ncbi:MAG TPA: VCBS repeat-containing protein, partial [Thermoanaerobaculia bacterium]|nr:VCBS repeat-containing protein [Thermoanaerobaculia bacterium]
RALRKRRADLRTAVPWRRVMAGVVAAGAIGAALLVPRLATPKPRNIRFARMETRGFTAIAAMSKNGETLWQKTDVDSDAASQVALARIEPNQPPLLAAIFAKRRNYLPDGGRQMLLLLDPDTGEVRRRVKLPSPGPLFGYSDRYHVRTIHAVDLDHDGIDEIIVSYSHAPEAPGVVVLYEPKLNRARIVFEGEGGHVFAMAQDLDGDGRPELLLAGINNGFDWINAMTAIRIRPWIGETVEPGAASNDEMLYSPQRAGWNDANLLWYALLPRGQMPVSPTALQWDDARKQISIEYLDGRKVVLTRDGFRVDEPSTLAPTKRQELRRAAYAHYRECVRLLAGEFFDAAVDEITKAVDDAQNANDAVLVEAMQRIQGRALILGGRAAEGEALMRGIAKNSENASEIAYDTAVAFHLAGDLDRALRWYETGYGHGAARNFGKSKHEFIQGIVFVLCERREWARADEAMTRFRESFLFEHKRDWASMYGEFIRWRAGETPKFDDLDVNSFTIDVMRYWKLEFRNQRGEDPAELMKGVEEEIAVDSAPRSGLWSLKAELLERLGRPAEAAEAMRRAWDFSRVDRKSSIVAHAHVPIVAERLKRLARVEGR